MLLLIIFVIVGFLDVNGKLICTLNQTVTLQANQVYFIESPDFPRPMTKDEKDNCYFNFTKEFSTIETNKKLIFAVTNSYPYYCVSCGTNFTVYPYQPFYYFKFDDSAFQGYILFDDWNDDCYFESVSRVNPFYVSDESQIINLKNGLNGYSSSNLHPCLWQFKAPIGYGFKIVIDEIRKDKITHFSISNNDYAFANEKDVRHNFPYYSYNNYLKINLNEGNQTTEFSAYITIFKLQFEKIDANCIITTGENGEILWTNFHNNSGYLNNAKCSYERVIKPNTETRVSIEMMNVESYVDHVYFYFDGNDSLPIDISGMSDALSLYPNWDNTERTVLWEFISDGSIRSLGFSLIFEEIPCSCGDPLIIVPCEGIYSFKFMNRTDGYYCGNLNCNFTIILDPKCNKSEVIKMEIFVGSYLKEENDVFDVFRIFSDNITVLEINHLNRYQHSMFLYSNSSNTFQAITATTFYDKKISVYLNVYGAPTDVSTIFLTNDKPYYAYNICENKPPKLFNIELSDELKLENASIEIYTTVKNLDVAVLFFNDESITHKINFEECFAEDSAQLSCKTTKTKFSVLHFNDNLDTYNCRFPFYLIFQSTTHSKGCVFKNNIHDMDTDYKKYPVIVSAMSNSIGSCRIFIFPRPLVDRISDIWTSPTTNGTIKIYAGSESKQFAVIDAHSTSSWHDIVLNSQIYIFEIPKNASMAIYVNFPSYHVISQYPYNSIFTSPHFGEPKMILSQQNYTYDPYITYRIHDCTVKFTLVEYKLDSRIQYYFIAGKERINITADFGTKIFSKTDVKVYYQCLPNATCFGSQDLVFHIEALENGVTPSPSPTTNHLQQQHTRQTV